MKKSHLCYLLLTITIISLLLPLSVCAEDEAVLPSGLSYGELGAALDAFLEEHGDNNAAVAVAVFDGKDDLYSRSFGFIDTGKSVPLDENCVLEWGSTTKLTVWLSIIQLVSDGKLDLDADVRGYLPEGFLKNLHYDEPITVLNLMNHNAGFEETDFVLEVTDTEDIIPLGEYLAKYQPNQYFRPGEVVAYSNWGAALAGYVVECVSGMSFSDYAQQNIFKPLEMNDTAIAADLSDNPSVAERRKNFVTYLPDGTLSTENNKVYILPYPAGMCTSTLADFATFAKALLNRDSRLLSEDYFDLLYSPSLYYTDTDIPRLFHGFLIDYDFAVPVLGHDGNTLGGSSRLMLDFENGVGMVVFCNQLGGSLYRTKMAEKVFGTAEYHYDLDGHYMPARSIFSGSSKIYYNLFLYNACHFTSEMVDGMYINPIGDRFEISTCDYLLMGPWYAVRDVLTAAWIACAVYCLITALVRLTILIVVKAKKKPHDGKNTLALAYGAFLSLPLILLLGAIPSIIGFIYMILLAAFSVFYAAGIKKKDGMAPTLTKLDLAQKISLLLCAAVTLANLIIWDMIVFW